MEINLRGKLALVTGGGGQLGRVISRTLAACGADVVINYNHSQPKAEAVLREVLALGVRGMINQADVTDQTAILAMKSQILAVMGKAP